MSNHYVKADIYLRLSSEETGKNESSSITNQRDVILQYCVDNSIEVVREFVDDGFSGANFSRPAFQQMLDHISKESINMVITKDLSRLGRDMGESSYYAEQFFPENGIHYIAISDNFDSEKDNLLAPFQFAMNDVYLRDTSRKIKTVLNQKKSKGKYSACPPYGYKKEFRTTDHLVPDEETAPNVKMIFSLAVGGMSTRKIADYLNDNGVIPPLKYRVEHRDNFSERGAARASEMWNYTTVKRILRNRVYLGHTVLGKTKKISIKSKQKIPVDQSQWYVTTNTHEPLVSEQDFNIAQQYIIQNTLKYNDAIEKNGGQRNSIFRGLVYCAKCGAAMCSGGTVYKGEREGYWYLACNNIPIRSPKHCPDGARIRYRDLVQIVTDDLNSIIDLSDDEINDIVSEVLKNYQRSDTRQNISEQKRSTMNEIKNSDRIIEKLYRDNIDGKISDDRLDRMVEELEQKNKRLKAKLMSLDEADEQQDNHLDGYKQLFELAKRYTHITTLTPEIVNAFIDRIVVDGRSPATRRPEDTQVVTQQNITIYYKFIGNTAIIPDRAMA